MKHKDKIKLAKKITVKTTKDGKKHFLTTGWFSTEIWQKRKEAIQKRVIKQQQKIHELALKKKEIKKSQLIK